MRSVFVVIKTVWVPKRVCVCVVDDESKKPIETSESTKVPLHYFSRVSVHLFHESFMNVFAHLLAN